MHNLKYFTNYVKSSLSYFCDAKIALPFNSKCTLTEYSWKKIDSQKRPDVFLCKWLGKLWSSMSFILQYASLNKTRPYLCWLASVSSTLQLISHELADLVSPAPFAYSPPGRHGDGVRARPLVELAVLSYSREVLRSGPADCAHPFP